MSVSSIPGQDRKAAARLRFQSLNTFIDAGLAEAELTPAAALVWLVLFRFVDARTGLATVSTDRIAECTGLNRKTVTRSLSMLKRAKLVKVKAAGGINRGPSSYAIRSTPPAAK